MKKLILVLGFLALCPVLKAQTVQCLASNGAWGPCPFVQPVTVATVSGTAQVNTKTSTTGTTVAQAFPGTTTAGNSILCIGMEAAAAAPTFADGQSNTYVLIGSSTTAPGYSVYEASNIVGGTTDTVTMTVTSGAANFGCYELKGSGVVGQIWDYENAQQGTAASIAFAQQSALTPNDLAVVMVGMGGGTVSSTPSIANVPTALVTVDQNNTTITSGALDVVYTAHANVTNLPTFTQSVTLSASETYSGVIVAIKPISVNLAISSSPCQFLPHTYTPFSLTASGQEVTGTAGKQTYVCSIDLVTATAQNIALVEGTGTTCGTNTAGMAGGTTAATGWNFAANGGIVKGEGGWDVYKTATDGDNVCLLLSSTGQTSGSLEYVQQ